MSAPLPPLCLRLQRGGGVRGWGRDGLGTGGVGVGEQGREGVDVVYAFLTSPGVRRIIGLP